MTVFLDALSFIGIFCLQNKLYKRMVYIKKKLIITFKYVAPDPKKKTKI